MNETRILLIEDDLSIQNFIMLTLKTYGYKGEIAENGLTGISLFLSNNPDLILLDLGLPDIDGIDVLKQIRQTSEVPVIIISARSQEKDKITAFDLGADDYVTKPFHIGELMARIRVALKHSHTTDEKLECYQFGHLSINDELHKVTLKGTDIHLTPIEYKLLLLLVRHEGKVLAHKFIQKEVWGNETTDDYQTLRVFMASIRRKIEEDSSNPKLIITEVGIGYRFVGGGVEEIEKKPFL